MPELPEVHTTATHLNKLVSGKSIKDVWTDWPKYFRLSGGEKKFRKSIAGRKIISVGRKNKNVLFRLSGGYMMLVHQKMTGHFLVGRWIKNKKQETRDKRQGDVWANQKWIPADGKGFMRDDRNRFIRLIFFLSNGEMLALSDLRRFAKVVLGSEEKILNLPELRELGPEAIDPKFTFGKFLKNFGRFKARKRGKIKQVLLDQTFVSGLGNIYADESLWHARLNPLRPIASLKEAELRRLYSAIRSVLKDAIKHRGSSIDDYRDPAGRPGFYHLKHKVYHREGKPCSRCGSIIKRIKIGQRSAHFCPKCQK